MGGEIYPSKIADLVLKIKKTKHIYSKNASKKLKLLSIVQARLQLKIFKMILKQHPLGVVLLINLFGAEGGI